VESVRVSAFGLSMLKQVAGPQGLLRRIKKPFRFAKGSGMQE